MQVVVVLLVNEFDIVNMLLQWDSAYYKFLAQLFNSHIDVVANNDLRFEVHQLLIQPS